MNTIAEMTEKELSAQVSELCKTLAWNRYHTFRSKFSPAGYPDETLWKDRLIFLELKTRKGRLSKEQARVILELLRADAEVYVIRPEDLQDLANVLASRRDIYGHLTTQSGRESAAKLSHKLRNESIFERRSTDTLRRRTSQR